MSMVKHIGTTNNYLLKLIKEQRKESIYVHCLSICTSEQLFIFCKQLNSFNCTDLSFIQTDSDIFRFPLLFLKFLAMILKFS